MRKHTPGEWRASGSSILPVNEGASAVASAATHRAEWRANAALIAAAPEMLDALKRALWQADPSGSWIPECSPSLDPDAPQWVQIARAAIAKAEGA